MKKNLLTTKRAEQIQREIYYNMSPHKKIELVNDFYMLALDFKKLKIVLKNDSKGTSHKNN